MKKQRAAAKALGVPSAKFHGQNGAEENWRYAMRIEVKSGAQVGPIATRYLLAEKQSEQNRAVGDGRGFLMVAMPKDWGSDGLAVIRLSALRELLDAQ